MSFMKGDLLSKARKLMKGGIMARPRWLEAVIRYPIEQLFLCCCNCCCCWCCVFFFPHNFCCFERIVERWVFLFCFPWETEYLHSRRRHDVIEHPTSSYLRIDWWNPTMHAILRPNSYPSSKGLTSFFFFFFFFFFTGCFKIFTLPPKEFFTASIRYCILFLVRVLWSSFPLHVCSFLGF